MDRAHGKARHTPTQSRPAGRSAETTEDEDDCRGSRHHRARQGVAPASRACPGGAMIGQLEGAARPRRSTPPPALAPSALLSLRILAASEDSRSPLRGSEHKIWPYQGLRPGLKTLAPTGPRLPLRGWLRRGTGITQRGGSRAAAAAGQGAHYMHRMCTFPFGRLRVPCLVACAAGRQAGLRLCGEGPGRAGLAVGSGNTAGRMGNMGNLGVPGPGTSGTSNREGNLPYKSLFEKYLCLDR